MKRKRQSLPGEPYPRRESDDNETSEQITPITPPTPTTTGESKSELPSSDQDKDLERSLIGSLVDSYGFRPDGLVKKTMSISINGISHHMVSYYKVEEVKKSMLSRPLSDPRLQGISVRPELYLKQNFRAPVEETEHYAIDGQMNAHPQMMYSMPSGAYAVRPGQYFGGQQYQSMYAMPTTTASPYGSVAGTAWQTQPQGSGSVAYPNHPTYGSQSYGGYYRPPGQPGKTEDNSPNPQSMQYGSQYPPAYPALQRSASQSTPTMPQSAYHTPVQPSPSTFGPMNSRPSYSSATMPSPTANGQPQAAYGSTPTQQYAVRSPPQGYHMQPAQPSVASPKTDLPATAPNHDLAYRTGDRALQYY
jgi:hypothetical protein